MTDVLHLSISDLRGGAARGAYWLHRALRSAGLKAKMLVAYKEGADPHVIAERPKRLERLNLLRAKIDSFPLKAYPQRAAEIFSPAWVPGVSMDTIRRQGIDPKIINLHWVTDGFVHPRMLRKMNRPIVWTLRDMWPFTGGCHYSGACTRYVTACGTCPVLRSEREEDLSRSVFRRKQKAWQGLDLTLVGLSRWIADAARSSHLFRDCRIEVIPNAIDHQRFKPVPRSLAREQLGLTKDKRYILFGAIAAMQDERKGFSYLLSAVRELATQGFGRDTEVLVFGAEAPSNPPDFGLPATYLGRINDDARLALIYTAADVMVTPSTQEAFGKTAMEAMACGTPAVVFDATGLRDIVDHRLTGYRAQPFSSDDLAGGMAWVLQDPERRQRLGQAAREKVEREFTYEVQAQKYSALYQELLG